MKIQEKDKITPTQLTFFIIQSMIGVGVLSLPYNVHQVARGGAWISVIVAGVLAQIILLIHWSLCKRHPHQTLYGIFIHLSGRWIGTAMTVIYIVFFLLICEVIVLHYTDIISRWILTETPRWIIMLLLVATSVYLGRENTRVISRFNVVNTFILVVVTIWLSIGYFDADFRYTFPIDEAGWANIFLASHQAFTAMIGFEIVLILFPFVAGTSREILKAASLGNWIAVAFYTFLTFTCLVVFAPQEIVLIPEPVIFMTRAFTLRVVERVDLIFLSAWVVYVLTSFVTYIHLISIGVQELWGDRGHVRGKSASFVGLAAFIPAVFISNPGTIKMLDKMISITGYLMLVGIPLLYLLLSKLRERGKKRAWTNAPSSFR